MIVGKKIMSIILGTFIIVILVAELLFRTVFLFFEEYQINKFNTETKILKGKPNFRGRYINSDSIGHFSINNEGWNSPKDYYKEKKFKYRIACIGASETEALQIDIKNAYPNILESELRDRNIDNEVYSFAKSRTSLAQALHVARYVINTYKPDIITVTPINDVLTVIPKPTNFMRVTISTEGSIKEILPTSYVNIQIYKQLPVFSKLVSHSRFLLFLRKVIVPRIKYNYLRIYSLIKNNDDPFNLLTLHEDYIIKLKNRYPSFRKKYELARQYILNQFKMLELAHKVKFLFIIGPLNDKLKIRNCQLKGDEEISLIKEYLTECSLQYLDLTNKFWDDYFLHGKIFTFKNDYFHFNEYGHYIAGKIIADFLIKNDYFTVKPDKWDQS
jgi:lysophospholipase L1-like esterase